MNRVSVRFHDNIQTTYPWAEALRGELIRVFWQFPETTGWSFQEVNQWRDSAYNLLGWLPQDTIYMNIILFERDLDELEALAGRQTSGHVGPDVAGIKFSDREEEEFAERWEAESETREPSEPPSPEQLRRSLGKMRSDLLKQQQRYREAGWLGDAPAV